MILDFQSKASESAFLEQFNEIVTDVPAEDMYYLLQTFASMALSRELKDLEFIRCVTTDLFKVSILCVLKIMKLIVSISNMNFDQKKFLIFYSDWIHQHSYER